MSENRELLTILQTLQTYSECDITHSFTEHCSEPLFVSYSKELESFIIIQNGTKETYDDIHSALTRLEHL
ncbi:MULTISPECIES: hypothetical protein [unclassified Rossellomorea]|uniref:hypothetical protein n=1 Tax=unclassified Rossellomorea TaxID=2837526 RepID=UPI0026299E2A|nr:hypothetical protein [uncultured Rossellomorea sp.]